MKEKSEEALERSTAQLFDNNFKFIMAEASPPAVVHLINGLFKKRYPLDTPVKIEPNEHIKRNHKSGRLGKIVSDIVVTLFCGEKRDTYLIEAQIGNDMDMCLRVFEYSISVALKDKHISDGGSYLRIEMPAPAVVYFEGSKAKDFLTIEVAFPGEKSIAYKIPAFKVLEHKVSELEHMVLLLPFYLLKIRKELRKSGKDSEKRKKLAKELAGYVAEICEILRRSSENSYITDVDATMLQECLSNMHTELYGGYEEMTEVEMTLKQMHESSVLRKIEKAEAMAEARAEARVEAMAEARIEAMAEAMAEVRTAKAEKRGISLGIEKVFALLEQGVSLAEAKVRLGVQ